MSCRKIPAAQGATNVTISCKLNKPSQACRPNDGDRTEYKSCSACSVANGDYACPATWTQPTSCDADHKAYETRTCTVKDSADCVITQATVTQKQEWQDIWTCAWDAACDTKVFSHTYACALKSGFSGCTAVPKPADDGKTEICANYKPTTGDAGSPLPVGSKGQTMRYIDIPAITANGTTTPAKKGWEATDFLTNSGSRIGIGVNAINDTDYSTLHIKGGQTWGTDLSLDATGGTGGKRWVLGSTSDSGTAAPAEGVGKFILKDGTKTREIIDSDSTGDAQLYTRFSGSNVILSTSKPPAVGSGADALTQAPNGTLIVGATGSGYRAYNLSVSTKETPEKKQTFLSYIGSLVNGVWRTLTGSGISSSFAQTGGITSGVPTQVPGAYTLPGAQGALTPAASTALKIGCFVDTGDRALNANGNNSSLDESNRSYTIEGCIALARSKHLAFAGLQYYGECFGGNTLGYAKEPDDSQCNTPCNADPSRMCGGTWHNTIYATGIGSTMPPVYSRPGAGVIRSAGNPGQPPTPPPVPDAPPAQQAAPTTTPVAAHNMILQPNGQDMVVIGDLMAAPANKLEVANVTKAKLGLTATGPLNSVPVKTFIGSMKDNTRFGALGTESVDNLVFYTANIPRMALTADGRLAIGRTETPTAGLEVQGAFSATPPDLFAGYKTTTAAAGSPSTKVFSVSGDGGGYFADNVQAKGFCLGGNDPAHCKISWDSVGQWENDVDGTTIAYKKGTVKVKKSQVVGEDLLATNAAPFALHHPAYARMWMIATKAGTDGKADADESNNVNMFIDARNDGTPWIGARGQIDVVTNHDLEFLTNDTDRMVITKEGRVGIGMIMPQAQLDVYSTTQAQSPTDPNRTLFQFGGAARESGFEGWVGGSNNGELSVGDQVTLAGQTRTVIALGSPGTIAQNFLPSAPFAVVGVNGANLGTYTYKKKKDVFGVSDSGKRLLTVSNSGYVGIGTANPRGLLDVGGNTRYFALSQTPARADMNACPAGLNLTIESLGAVCRDGAMPAACTPAPESCSDGGPVNTCGDGTDATYIPANTCPPDPKVYVVAERRNGLVVSSDGTVGVGTMPDAGFSLNVAGWSYFDAVKAGRAVFEGNGMNNPAVTLKLDGNVNTSLAKDTGFLQIGGDADANHTNMAIDWQSIQVRNGGQKESGGENYKNLYLQPWGGKIGIKYPQGASLATDYALDVNGGINTVGNINVTYSGSNLAKVNAKDRLAFANDRIGLDVAELYETQENVEVGDVLVSGDTERKLKKSGKPYENGIIGVVSGAPALLFEGSSLKLGAKPERFTKGSKPPVALAGRVPVKVSLENGVIHVGDYLTSSGKPGVAMRATDPGMALGVALENYDGGANETVLTFINIGEKNIARHLQELEKAVKELKRKK